jgi:23S rRNA (cytidine1920-2'-O)/16S rRNA (cytidine1409-2'-O)-methyltransferase
MANPKIRADQLLVEQGLAESRERAKRLVMAGLAYIHDGDKQLALDKPGRLLSPSTILGLKEPERFVSRGAYKLLTAIEHFNLDVRGLVCLDVGASTGGFTDCLLQHGAAKVYAVDVGQGQLHEKLRPDPRVIALEGVNFRLAKPDLLPEKVDLAVIDVSFISLTKVLHVVKGFLKTGAKVLALVKPQFELGPNRTVKGVVRDEAAQMEAVAAVSRHAVEDLGHMVHGCVASKLKGPKGNQEYMLLLS